MPDVDPLEDYNRPLFALGQNVDAATIKPLAGAYSRIPETLRARVTKALANMDDVPTMLNNLLQGKFSDGTSDLMRILVNSTIGILGLFDVASAMGLQKHDEDFGQTLGVWGIGEGAYIFIPLLGPSTMRDFPAFIVDEAMHPATYFAPGARRAVIIGRVVDERANLLDKEEFIKTWSSDYYQVVRNYYLSQRRLSTSDGAVDESVYDYEAGDYEAGEE